MTAKPVQGELKPGEWVAYRDNLEDEKFHVGKVASTGDFVTLETWATTAKQLSSAQWKPLYQIQATGQYTTEAHARRQHIRIVDDIPEADKDDYILMRNLAMLRNKKLTASS